MTSFKYEEVKTTARLTTLLSPIVAVLYSLLLGLLAAVKPISIPVGAFQGGSILLFPLLLAVALLAWKWPLPGGIVALVMGMLILFPILDAKGWPTWYKIPYITFWAVFMIGGILHTISVFYRKAVMV